MNQRIQAGIKRAFNFQRTVYSEETDGAPRVTALIENKVEGVKTATETIFDSVIIESSLRSKKAQRQGLYKSIISLFEKDVTHETTPTNEGKASNHGAADRVPLLAFASQILAHLPYNCASDPLFVVYHATSITALDGHQITTRFAELVGNDICDPNAEEDDLEKAAKLKDPKSSSFARKLISDENFNCSGFAELCVKASGLR